MKVILTQDVKSQGKKGQLIEVSEGYGRNYLLPRKLATEATADNMNKMKLQDKARLAREAAEKAEAEAVGTQLEGILVKVSGKAGTGGRLFGSITTKEIADALKEQFQIDIPKTKLVQDDPIKAFGTYQVKCKLGYEVTGTVNVLVTEEK
ncbi:MAG: 50S ribosomal protein L9 [Oscillospiraceae bacterium]